MISTEQIVRSKYSVVYGEKLGRKKYDQDTEQIKLIIELADGRKISDAKKNNQTKKLLEPET